MSLKAEQDTRGIRTLLGIFIAYPFQ